MRELTNTEMDAVGGGAFDSGFLSRNVLQEIQHRDRYVRRQSPVRADKRGHLRSECALNIPTVRSRSRRVSHTPPLRRRSVHFLSWMRPSLNLGLGSCGSRQSLVGQALALAIRKLILRSESASLSGNEDNA